MSEDNQLRYKLVAVRNDSCGPWDDCDVEIPTFAIESVTQDSPDAPAQVHMIDGAIYEAYSSKDEFLKGADDVQTVVDEDNLFECLSALGSAEMHHMEQEEDENLDGEWEYTDYEVSDGTVRDNFPISYYRVYDALRALSIIRDKEVDPTVFNDSPDLAWYNGHWYTQRQLTQEEFDILKRHLQ